MNDDRDLFVVKMGGGKYPIANVLFFLWYNMLIFA